MTYSYEVMKHESLDYICRSIPQSSMPCSCTPPAGSSNSDPEPKSAAHVKAHKPVQRSRTRYSIICFNSQSQFCASMLHTCTISTFLLKSVELHKKIYNDRKVI